MTIAKESKRIDKITVKRIQDDDGQLDYLGEFADSPDDYAIVATGEHEGEFVKDLPCECGLTESQHTECSGQTIGEWCELGENHCCEFDRVEISRGHDYRYFNPQVDSGVTDDDEQRKYAMQDYDRAKDYGQSWWFMGVKAEAQISIPDGGRTAYGQTRTIQRIASGGLWGIESDSEDSYFTEIEDEELSQLKDQLHALGFSKRAISVAFRNVERVEV